MKYQRLDKVEDKFNAKMAMHCVDQAMEYLDKLRDTTPVEYEYGLLRDMSVKFKIASGEL